MRLNQTTYANNPAVGELLTRLSAATQTDSRLELMRSFFAPRTRYNAATDRRHLQGNSLEQIAIATAAAQTVYGHTLVHESISPIGCSATRHFEYEYEVLVRRMGLPCMIVNSTDTHWVGYAEHIKRYKLRILCANKFDSPWLNWQGHIEEFGLNATTIDDPAAHLLRSDIGTLRAEFPLATFFISDGYERHHAAMSMGLAQLRIDVGRPATALLQADQYTVASLEGARVSLRLPAFASCSCSDTPDDLALLSARVDYFNQPLSMNARISAGGGLRLF